MPNKKVRVLFVCTGNTCRSPMLKLIFLDLLKKQRMLTKFDIKSAGIFAINNQKMSQNAVKALKKANINVKEHLSKKISPKLIEKSDIIICLEQSHKIKLKNFTNNIISIRDIEGLDDIPDPYGQQLSCYIDICNYMIKSCPYILKHIQSLFFY